MDVDMTRPYLAVDLYVEHYHQFWYRWVDVHHVIGYGLDCDGYYRNLPYVGELG